MTDQSKELLNWVVVALRDRLIVVKRLLNEEEYSILKNRLINLINNL